MWMSCETWYEDYLGDCCNNDCAHCYGDKENIFAKDNFKIIPDSLNDPIRVHTGERFWIHDETDEKITITDDRYTDFSFTVTRDFFKKHFSYSEINKEEKF